MNDHPQKKVGAAASGRLDEQLPPPPNEMLRDWIRAVDLQKVGRHFLKEQSSTGIAGTDSWRRIPIRFYKPKRQRVKVSFAKPV